MITLIIITFIVGYILIALSETIKINKAAIALLLGVTLWIMYIFSGVTLITGASPVSFHDFIQSTPEISGLSPAKQAMKYVSGLKIIDVLGNTAEILFYLLGAMTIVEMIDQHRGFIGITNLIKTRNKKKLLWLVALLTFFMSSVLDNMTSAIVMMTLLQKLLTNPKERWFFGSIIIIAANAGGTWTPIGDITTIMLWINNNITSGEIMKSLLIPGLISLILPTWIVAASLKKQPLSTIQVSATSPSPANSWLNNHERNAILILGLLCLLLVPIFKSLTNLPPFMGILFTLGMAWIYIEVLYNRKPQIPADQQYRIPYILSKIDFSTILFFLGILMAVGTLEAIGILGNITNFLNTKIHNIYIINIIIGFLSSVIDNVPLVAAVMGMYPVVSPETLSTLSNASYMANFVQNGKFWELAAYCAGTGGSLLIIGSAAGVVVMGLEKISFIWYLKHISWIALTGFLAGIGVYYLFNL